MDTDRAQMGERRIATDQWDVDGWQLLLSEAAMQPLSVATPVYERIIAQFPPAAKFWTPYIDHVRREHPEDPAPLTDIFERAVIAAPVAVDIWRAYIAHLSVYSTPSATLAVCDRAVKLAGLDLNAHVLWAVYLEFANRQREEGVSIELVRNVYQRAVRAPIHNLDSFWRDYAAFEHAANPNKDAVRAFLQEHQARNIDARAEFRARRTRRELLTISAIPVPPRGRAKEASQAHQWRRFVAHERENPHSLSASDLNTRVIHAFESALSPLYRYPDMWIEYMSYMYSTLVNDMKAPQHKGSTKEIAAKEAAAMTKAFAVIEPVLERAVRAVPTSVAVHAHVNWICVRLKAVSKGIAKLEKLVKTHPSPLAYIHLMRAARRGEGQQKEKARKVFGRARKDPKGNHPAVYVAAALIEFNINKDKRVARNIFEFGLKQHPNSAVMTMEFVKWLWGIPDLEYARVVLKKVMPDVKGTPEQVRELWEKWLELEDIIGDTKSVDEVEAMWREADPSRGNTTVFDVARRTRFLSFESFTEDDLSSIDNPLKPKSDGNANGNGGAVGKRDPRTGRRVASSGAGRNGATNNSRHGKESVVQSIVMKVATEWLDRMSSSFANTQPPPIVPTPKEIFQLLKNTPDSFKDTPAAKQQANQSIGNGKMNITTKKRKAQDSITASRTRQRI